MPRSDIIKLLVYPLIPKLHRRGARGRANFANRDTKAVPARMHLALTHSLASPAESILSQDAFREEDGLPGQARH